MVFLAVSYLKYSSRIIEISPNTLNSEYIKYNALKTISSSTPLEPIPQGTFEHAELATLVSVFTLDTRRIHVSVHILPRMEVRGGILLRLNSNIFTYYKALNIPSAQNQNPDLPPTFLPYTCERNPCLPPISSPFAQLPTHRSSTPAASPPLCAPSPSYSTQSS